MGFARRASVAVGIGAFATAGAAQATISPDVVSQDPVPIRSPQTSVKALTPAALWLDGDAIMVRQGDVTEALNLSNTTEANALRQVLRNSNATADNPRWVGDKIILVGGGGSGVHWGSAAEKKQAPPSTGTDQPQPPPPQQ